MNLYKIVAIDKCEDVRGQGICYVVKDSFESAVLCGSNLYGEDNLISVELLEEDVRIG